MIYLDHGATTPVDKEVIEAMLPYFRDKYGNASSLHQAGREAREAVEDSREKIAKLINAKSEEIIFTSGGTESDNMAIKGIAFANKDKGNHIITTKIEHHAVLNTCKYLEKHGFEVTYLPVDKYGFVNLEQLENSITKQTILVSIMHSNNEIGTLEPIQEIGKICNEHGIYFHTDAVQSVGKLPLDVKKLNVDLLSASSHKIYGPKGVGCLFVKQGTKIDALLYGGSQEFKLRAGTENVPGIVGFGKACELAQVNMEKQREKLISLRDMLIKGLLQIEDSWLNGHPNRRLPNNAHFCFKYIEGESLILRLDDEGIAASTGSACSSKSLEPSHVLLAIGLKPQEAHGSLRLTLGKDNTKEQIKYVLEIISKIVEDLRKISPLAR